MFQTNSRRRKPPSGGVPVPVAVEHPCPILPDDVIGDIFARLPAKFVHRCLCLSRAWATTLASKDFADLHLRLANRHGGPRVMFLQDSHSSGRHPTMQTWSPDNPRGTNLEDVRGRVDNLIRPRIVTQQCRGLVILVSARTYYVLNPSTGRIAALPVPESPVTSGPNTAGQGLGYDTRRRTHKVVRFFYLPWSTECQVYEINSMPARWRPAKGYDDRERPLDWPNNAHDMSVFTQGHVNWLAKRKPVSLPEEMFVFFFNVNDETFATVPLPPLNDERYYEDHHYLTELGGRLCLFHADNEVVDDAWLPWYNVWLLNANGHGIKVWDLHCRIDLSSVPWNIAKFMRFEEWIAS